MKIYLSELSIRRTIRERSLTPSGLPAFVTGLGFAGVEISDRTLARFDAAELQRFRAACAARGCGFVLDVSCDLTYEGPESQRREVEHVTRMIELGQRLGARCAKIWLGGQSVSLQRLRRRRREAAPGSPSRGKRSPGPLSRALSSRPVAGVAHALRRRLPSRVPGAELKIERAITALRKIVPRAVELDVRLAIENHWGVSSRPANILRAIEAVGSPYLGVCPDFGNLPRDVDLYRALRLLASRTFLVHAKSARFTPDGEERQIDYRRCLRILRDRDYDGVITVEYLGGGDELLGSARTRALILKYW